MKPILSRFLNALKARKTPSYKSRRRGVRPRLEALEDRLVMHALTAIPVLHSNAGAAASLYLDFDGNYEDYWGDTFLGIPEFDDVRTPVFDLDRDRTSFSDRELEVIRLVWEGVAEDYAPFNIDVTTQRPDHGPTLRVAIGGSWRDWWDEPNSGISKRNAFTNDVPNVCFVFSGDIGDNPLALATTASHEAGHSFGLAHQQLFDPDPDIANEYNPGTSVWTPIMGNNLSMDRTTWHNGAIEALPEEMFGIDVERALENFADPDLYPVVNQDGTVFVYQNDMEVIARSRNHFGWRADDHGNSFAEATRLEDEGLSHDLALFGVTAAHDYEATGIIGTLDDADTFALRAAHSGQLVISVAVAGNSMANLDAVLEIWSDGELVASVDPGDYSGGPNTGPAGWNTGELDASHTFLVQAGKFYYFVVRSHGTYGDVGQYAITADLTPEADGPHVIGCAPSLEVTGGQIVLTFNEPIDAATFTPADVQLRELSTGTMIRISSVIVRMEDARFATIYASLACGRRYELVVGPNLTDLNGNFMNQDRDGINGEAIQDQFRTTFEIPCDHPESDDRGPEHPAFSKFNDVWPILQVDYTPNEPPTLLNPPVGDPRATLPKLSDKVMAGPQPEPPIQFTFGDKAQISPPPDTRGIKLPYWDAALASWNQTGMFGDWVQPPKDR